MKWIQDFGAIIRHLTLHFIVKRIFQLFIYTMKHVLELVSFQKAAKRGDYGHERYEKLEFQLKVAQYYQVLRDESWKVILSLISSTLLHASIFVNHFFRLILYICGGPCEFYFPAHPSAFLNISSYQFIPISYSLSISLFS